MQRTLWLSCVVLALWPAVGRSQPPKQAVVMFKDGFHVKGRVIQNKSETVTDPVTGSIFRVPGGGDFIFVDDGVRRINFPSFQVQEVLELKPEQLKEQMRLHMNGSLKRGAPAFGMVIEGISDWDKRWERTLKINGPDGRGEITQRLTDLTPYAAVGMTIGYAWDFGFLTREFEPKQLRTLVERYLIEQTSLKEFERRKELSRFFAQLGWYELATTELQDLAQKFPEQSEALKELRAKVRQQQAETFTEDLERMYRVGQHDRAQQGVAELGKDEELMKQLADKSRLAVQDLKAKYAELTMRLAQAEQCLKDFPKYTADRPVWTAACKVIRDEMNIDTLGRLKTFLDIAPQHAKELQANQKPTQKTDEVLALAVTGWLQGDDAAGTDPKVALQLFRLRGLVLNYLRTERLDARQQALSSFTKVQDVPIDVLIRLVRLLPPAEPYTGKMDSSEPTKMTVAAPEADSTTYFLQLPPEYHPLRSYPVLVLMHSHREKADALVRRWQGEAARHGFILVAPIWGTGLRPKYDYTRSEHTLVLDTIRDVRRRFNVDGDRVFMYGWEQGANAAFDIGLAHPDQFAGVLPMNGDCKGFAERYWSNGQYLPFYIVEGDRNGVMAKSTRDMFKDWIRSRYPALYIEYKGRSSEWFGGELPNMMDWMSRKKRYHPMKEMGRYHSGGGVGEEFKTMRAGDNRFYWLSTDEILDRHINHYHSWSKATQAATLQAAVTTPSETTKAGVKTWSQFNIRTSGLKQVSLWLAPNQVDLSQPVVIRVNGQSHGGYRTIAPSLSTLLEELYHTGDRERVFVARIDLRL